MDGSRPLNWVITAEHASRRLPDGVDLGVSEEVLQSHVAWDPGALELAQALGDRLGVVPFLGEYTRLYVDLNRSEDREAVIPAVAFGTPVPGNAGADRESRLQAVYRPWRKRVEIAVGGALPCVHLSIHSFTPIYDGVVRPMDVGVLFDPERSPEAEISEYLLREFRSSGFVAEANQPYLGTGDGHTTWLRARYPKGYVGIEIELSQRIVFSEGIQRAAEVLSRAARGVGP